MSVILNIDTSSGAASVSVSRNGLCTAVISNPNQKEHASFLQPAIKKLLHDSDLQLKQLDAVAVVNGPGSYTGLRVGLASAKGICYALNLPLITINTLTLMAKAASMHQGQVHDSPTFLCPMIDARRMEVYTALYDQALHEISFPQAMVLDSHSFVATLLQNKVLFIGDGAQKMKSLTTSPNALFAGPYDNSMALCRLAFEKFQHQDTAILAYVEPFYLKDFFDK